MDGQGDVWRSTPGGWRQNAKVRLAALAAEQFGRVRYDQLRALGLTKTTIGRWHAEGYLHRVLPRVYAVGHDARSADGDLAAAVLYAGPGAMLSHATALFWLGLLKYPPDRIHVSTPRRTRSPEGICIHGRRRLERVWHRRLPVTTTPQALLDLAAAGPRDLLRLALASAEYDDRLNPVALQQVLGHGVPGSAALRQALRTHLPGLARTRSELEVRLLELCRQHGLPIPEVNVYVSGWLVDALWRAQRVVVELDGWRGHRTPAQLERDHRRDLELRAAGYVVLRYTWHQLTAQRALVAADLARALRGDLRVA